MTDDWDDLADKINKEPFDEEDPKNYEEMFSILRGTPPEKLVNASPEFKAAYVKWLEENPE